MASAMPNPRTERDQRCGLPAGSVPSAARRFAGKPRRPFAQAFTLAELLIAIAILGVCISLGATLFPLAIRTHAESVGNTIGMLIAENALTVAKTVLTDADVPAGNVVIPVATALPALSSYAFYYPAITTSPPAALPDTAEWVWVGGVPYPRTLTGTVVLARRIAPGRNDYQLIAIACEKEKPENALGWQTQTLDFDVNGTQVIQGGGGFLKAGGAIVVSTGTYAGRYAVIDTAPADGTSCKLKTPIAPGGAGVQALIVVEKDGATPEGIPVMAVMSTRTGLRPS